MLKREKVFEKCNGWWQLPAFHSAVMLMSGRIRAVKERILTAHEATMLVVCMQEALG